MRLAWGAVVISEDVARSIRDLRNSGLIHQLDVEGRIAWIDPSRWSRTNFQQKQDIGTVVARYFRERRGDGADIATLKDAGSGKRLAKVGVTGFSVD